MSAVSEPLFDYVPDAGSFESYLRALDIGVQLRGPSLGETSGVVVQLLAAQVPTVVSSLKYVPGWCDTDSLSTDWPS